MINPSSTTVIHCAVLAALVALSSNAVAGKYYLEGEAVNLTEQTYDGDIIGGQYIMSNTAQNGTYFGKDGAKRYDTIQNFKSTNIFLKKGTTVSGGLTGGSYLHTGKYDFSIGAINLTIEGSAIEEATISGNKINAWGLSSIKTKIRAIKTLITDGSNLKQAAFAGSSVKSQLANPQYEDSTQTDHIQKTSLTIIDSTANGIAGGSLTLSADSRPEFAHVSAIVDESTLVVDNSTVKTFNYISDLDYGLKTSSAIYGGGELHNIENGKSFENKVSQSTILVRNGSKIEGNIVAGGVAYVDDKNHLDGQTLKLEVTDSHISIEDSHVTGDVILGNEIIHKGASLPSFISTKLGQTNITLRNATVDGTLRGEDLIENRSGNQPVQSFVANNSSNSLTASGVNVLGGLTGVKDITLNVTEANLKEGAAVLTIKNGTLDLQDATIVVDGDLSVGSRNAVLMSLLDGAKTTGDNTKIVGKGVFVDQVWQADSTDDLTNLFQNGSLTTNTVDFTPHLNKNAQTLSEIRLGTLAFINQGAEFIADEGLSAMRQSVANGLTGFVAMHGGYSEYSTGTDVELTGISLVAGTAKRIDSTTVGAFFETGRGSSEAGISGSEADGDHTYVGVGASAIWNLNEQWAIDSALRFGRSSTEFDGKFNGDNAKYDSDVWYGSAHLGLSATFPLANGMDVQTYGRYVLSYIDGDNLMIEDADHSRLHMDDTWTHAVHVGTRLFGELPSTSLQWMTGIAYEHVFDGDSESTVQGISLATPSLGGDSAIAELSIHQTANKANTWGWSIGLKGYLGDRQGVTGQASVLYAF